MGIREVEEEVFLRLGVVAREFVEWDEGVLIEVGLNPFLRASSSKNFLRC